MHRPIVKSLVPQLVWFVFYYLIYLLVYYSICVREGLHWDEVMDLDGSANDMYCAAGRWALWLYKIAFGKGTQLLLAGLLAGAFISITLVIQAPLLKLKGWWLKALFGILTMASYQWAFALHYSQQSDAVALSILLCTLSAWLTYREGGLWQRILAAGMLVIALGVYQSMALYYAAVWIALFIANAHGTALATWLRQFAVTAAVSAAAVVSWWLLRSLFIECIPPEVKGYAEEYQSSLTEWPLVLSASSISEQLCMVWHYLRLSISNATGLGKASHLIFVAEWLPVAGLLLRFLTREKGLSRILLCLLCMMLWWIPFSLPFLLMTPGTGIRAWLAIPFSFAAVWVLWLGNMNIAKWGRAVIMCLALALMANTACMVHRDARKEAVLHKTTLSTLTEMHQRAMELAAQSGIQNPEILVCGSFNATEHPDINTKVFDGSHINWYGKQYHLTGIRKATKGDLETYSSQLEQMEKWPEAGSLARTGETTILIRLPKGSK